MMSNKNMTRKLLSLAAYTAIGTSLYGLSAGNALAWGVWGAHAAPGAAGVCTAPEVTGSWSHYSACSGWSFGSGASIGAMSVTSVGNIQIPTYTQTQGFRNASVIKTVTDHGTISDSTTTATAPQAITSHRCRCEGQYTPL